MQRKKRQCHLRKNTTTISCNLRKLLSEKLRIDFISCALLKFLRLYVGRREVMFSQVSVCPQGFTLSPIAGPALSLFLGRGLKVPLVLSLVLTYVLSRMEGQYVAGSVVVWIPLDRRRKGYPPDRTGVPPRQDGGTPLSPENTETPPPTLPPPYPAYPAPILPHPYPSIDITGDIPHPPWQASPKTSQGVRPG